MGGNPTGGYRRQLLLKTLVKLQGGRAANCSGNPHTPSSEIGRGSSPSLQRRHALIPGLSSHAVPALSHKGLCRLPRLKAEIVTGTKTPCQIWWACQLASINLVKPAGKAMLECLRPLQF